MSEAEILEMAHMTTGNMISSFAIYVSIASAYLIVAYLVGDKLTRPQTILVNALFIIVMLISINLVRMLSVEANLFYSEAVRLGSKTSMAPLGGEAMIYFSTLVNLLILVGCLKFMWDKRHS
jgi:hypothetical protein